MDAPRPLTVPEAQARLLARFHRGGAESVDLVTALGRVLAVEVTTAVDLPPFTNSAMDGYAVRAADIAGATASAPILLRVVGMQATGIAALPMLSPGEAVAITTGAPLPAGADAVVRLEDTDGGMERVAVNAAMRAGANIRRQGETVRAGTPLLPAGTRLGPGQVALLAANGSARPTVVRRPRIAVLSTGNELVPAGQPPQSAQIPDVNGPMLAVLIAEHGGIPIPLGIARDTPDDLERGLVAATDADLIITSGGVSVGASDAVRAVIAVRGALDFQQVRMRPGRPTAFGQIGPTPILALPGNPIAAFVAFHILARPAIARMLGVLPEVPQTVPARLRHSVEIRGEQETYLRARLRVTVTGWEADISTDQSVGNVVSLNGVNGLVVIPAGVARAQRGKTFQAIPLGSSLW